jgi:hypothetical protein
MKPNVEGWNWKKNQLKTGSKTKQIAIKRIRTELDINIK